jgi:hypothetical protein
MPRQSKRVATQGITRVSIPEVQAQNELMCNCGITSHMRSPDVNALATYNSLFRSLVGSVQHKAIHALFTSDYPAPMVMS